MKITLFQIVPEADLDASAQYCLGRSQLPISTKQENKNELTCSAFVWLDIF